MKLLDTTPKLFPPRVAEETAQMLNDTDDWTYIVQHDPKGTGQSLIKIFDEDGEFVSYLT